MPGWNTGVTYVSTSPVTDTLLNGIGYDFRTWGGNVDAGGYNLTNLAQIHGASNVLKLFTNSVERVRVTDTGLGIGGIAPSKSLAFPAATGDKFTLYNGQMWGMGIQAGVMQLITANSGGDIAFGYGSSAAFTEVVRIKGNGYVGIGTSSPVGRFGVCNAGSVFSNSMTLGSTSGILAAITSDTNDWGLYFGQATSGKSWIQAGRTNTATAYDLLLQASGGNVGINKTNPGSKLAVSGLPTYASNAAAISGGLTAGDFYTDGAGAVKVVF